MFGHRSNRPAPKPAILIGGALMTDIGGPLSVAVLFAERSPKAPLWAIVVAHVMALGGLACGIYLLIAGLRMP